MHEINFELSEEQLQVIQMPVTAKLFLEGNAGAGKTTVGIERVLHLLESGVPGESILVLLPQRTLAGPFYRVLQQSGVARGGAISILTFSGLAQRMINLFWPLIINTAGFSESGEYWEAHRFGTTHRRGIGSGENAGQGHSGIGTRGCC